MGKQKYLIYNYVFILYKTKYFPLKIDTLPAGYDNKVTRTIINRLEQTNNDKTYFLNKLLHIIK